MVVLDTRHTLSIEPTSKVGGPPSRYRPISPRKTPPAIQDDKRSPSPPEQKPIAQRPNTSPSPRRRPPSRAANATAATGGSASQSGDAIKPALDRKALNPHWRKVMGVIDRVNGQIEDSERVRGDQVAGDTLDLVEVDTAVRKEMMHRLGRKLNEMIDEQTQHAVQQSNNLEKVDTWLIEAAARLEQDDDGDPFAQAAVVRPDASVGAMLNRQTEMGQALSKVHRKMSQMVADLSANKASGEQAQAKVLELEQRLAMQGVEIAKAQSAVLDEKARADQVAHQARLQNELLTKQRDEARDEAAAHRTAIRKTRKEDRKALEEALEPLNAQVAKLSMELRQSHAVLEKRDDELFDLHAKLEEIAIKEAGAVKVINEVKVIKEVREVVTERGSTGGTTSPIVTRRAELKRRAAEGELSEHEALEMEAHHASGSEQFPAFLDEVREEVRVEVRAELQSELLGMQQRLEATEERAYAAEQRISADEQRISAAEQRISEAEQQVAAAVATAEVHKAAAQEAHAAAAQARYAAIEQMEAVQAAQAAAIEAAVEAAVAEVAEGSATAPGQQQQRRRRRRSGSMHAAKAGARRRVGGGAAEDGDEYEYEYDYEDHGLVGLDGGEWQEEEPAPSAAPSASDDDLGDWSRRYAAAHDAPGVPEDPAAVDAAAVAERKRLALVRDLCTAQDAVLKEASVLRATLERIGGDVSAPILRGVVMAAKPGVAKRLAIELFELHEHRQLVDANADVALPEGWKDLPAEIRYKVPEGWGPIDDKALLEAAEARRALEERCAELEEALRVASLELEESRARLRAQLAASEAERERARELAEALAAAKAKVEALTAGLNDAEAAARAKAAAEADALRRAAAGKLDALDADAAAEAVLRTAMTREAAQAAEDAAELAAAELAESAARSSRPGTREGSRGGAASAADAAAALAAAEAADALAREAARAEQMAALARDTREKAEVAEEAAARVAGVEYSRPSSRGSRPTSRGGLGAPSAMTSLLTEAQEEAAAARLAAQQALEELESLREEMAAAREEAAAARLAAQQALEELESLREQMAADAAAAAKAAEEARLRIKELEAKLKAAHADFAREREELLERQRELEARLAAAAALGAGTGEAAAAVKALEQKYREQFDALQAQLAAAAAERDEARRREKMRNTLLFMANKRKYEAIHQGKAWAATLEVELRSLEAAHAEATAAWKRAAAAAASSTQVRDHSEASLVLVARAIRQLSDRRMRRQLDEREAAHAAELEALRARFEAESAAWQSRLHAAEERAAAALSAQASLEAQLANLGQMASLHKDVGAAATQEARKKLEDAEERARAAQAAADAAAKERDDAQRRLAELEAALRALQEKLRESEAAVAAAEARAASAEARCQALEGAGGAAASALEAALEEERAAAARRGQQLNQQLAEQRAALAAAKEALERALAAAAADRARALDLEARLRDLLARSDAERVLALRLRRAIDERKLQGVKQQLHEMMAKVVDLASELSSERARIASERADLERRVREARGGARIASRYWQKKAQLQTVQAILADRKQKGAEARCAELEAYVTELGNADKRMAVLEAARRSTAEERDVARSDLAYCEMNLLEARQAAESVTALLAAARAAHDGAQHRVAELQAELQAALPLMTWKVQAEDVVRRDAQLHDELTTADQRLSEFETRLGALQANLAKASAVAGSASASLLARMADKEAREASRWSERRQQLMELREGNLLRGLSTLGKLMNNAQHDAFDELRLIEATTLGIGGSGGNDFEGRVPPVVRPPKQSSDFYNRQSTTINRWLELQALGRPESRPASPPTLPWVSSSAAPGAAAADEWPPRPRVAEDEGALSLAPAGAPGHNIERATTPRSTGRSSMLLPGLSQELSNALALAEEDGAAPAAAADAMSKLFEAAVRLTWNSKSPPRTAEPGARRPNLGSVPYLGPAGTASGDGLFSAPISAPSTRPASHQAPRRPTPTLEGLRRPAQSARGGAGGATTVPMPLALSVSSRGALPLPLDAKGVITHFSTQWASRPLLGQGRNREDLVTATYNTAPPTPRERARRPTKRSGAGELVQQPPHTAQALPPLPRV
jgi:chromosome segregation ATPase